MKPNSNAPIAHGASAFIKLLLCQTDEAGRFAVINRNAGRYRDRDVAEAAVEALCRRGPHDCEDVCLLLAMAAVTPWTPRRAKKLLDRLFQPGLCLVGRLTIATVLVREAGEGVADVMGAFDESERPDLNEWLEDDIEEGLEPVSLSVDPAVAQA